MNAKEARELFLKNDKTSVIRRKIDGFIKQAAQNGDSEVAFVLQDRHDSDAVIQTLKNDEFKAVCKHTGDARWGTDSYVYKISW